MKTAYSGGAKPDLAQLGLTGEERVAIERRGERVHFPAGSLAIVACGFDGGPAVATVKAEPFPGVRFEPAEGVISR